MFCWSSYIFCRTSENIENWNIEIWKYFWNLFFFCFGRDFFADWRKIVQNWHSTLTVGVERRGLVKKGKISKLKYTFHRNCWHRDAVCEKENSQTAMVCWWGGWASWNGTKFYVRWKWRKKVKKNCWVSDARAREGYLKMLWTTLCTSLFLQYIFADIFFRRRELLYSAVRNFPWNLPRGYFPFW